MDPTLSAVSVLKNPHFAFAAELRASLEAEQIYAAVDLGPTDALSEERRIIEYEAFYGPLSPDGTPSPSPSSSRSASPTPRTAPTSLPTPKLAPNEQATIDATIRSGNSKTRRNKTKSSRNRTAARQKQREERRSDPYEVRTGTFLNHIATAAPTTTDFDLKTIPVASTGFIALPDIDGGDICSADELVRNRGCRYIPWDGMSVTLPYL